MTAGAPPSPAAAQRRTQVAQVINSHTPASDAMLAAIHGVSIPTIKKDCEFLRDLGMIQPRKRGPKVAK